MNLAFAADDLPDIFLRGLTPSDASKYGMNGSLIPLNGTAHLLTLDGEIREVGLPKISVHSGTTFLFENGYLYACAPDTVSAVDLKTAEVSAQLSFGVG